MSEKDQIFIGVRFSRSGKLYHFNATKFPDIKLGDKVIVETSRGWQIGEVAQQVKDTSTLPEGGVRSIERIATEKDLTQKQNWELRQEEILRFCQNEAGRFKSPRIKFTACEIGFDGNRLTVTYASESDEKTDFKLFRQELQRKYNYPQIEFRQVGPRDVAKCLGGMGACGLETRCCTRFLTEFNSISIRMAKEQGISLTPSEITGMCGRLRCCLIYEYDFYVEARKQLPKRNSIVTTDQGQGKVVDIYPLRQSVLVEMPEVGYKEIPKSDIVSVKDKPQDPVVRQAQKKNHKNKPEINNHDPEIQ